MFLNTSYESNQGLKGRSSLRVELTTLYLLFLEILVPHLLAAFGGSTLSSNEINQICYLAFLVAHS